MCLSHSRAWSTHYVDIDRLLVTLRPCMQDDSFLVWATRLGEKTLLGFTALHSVLLVSLVSRDQSSGLL
jgi:hypothetical protein